MVVEGINIPALLSRLEAAPRADCLAREAAIVIRTLMLQVGTLDAEIVEAEWRAISHAVEIERMADHRYAMMLSGTRRSAR